MNPEKYAAPDLPKRPAPRRVGQVFRIPRLAGVEPGALGHADGGALREYRRACARAHTEGRISTADWKREERAITRAEEAARTAASGRILIGFSPDDCVTPKTRAAVAERARKKVARQTRKAARPRKPKKRRKR